MHGVSDRMLLRHLLGREGSRVQAARRIGVGRTIPRRLVPFFNLRECSVSTGVAKDVTEAARRKPHGSIKTPSEWDRYGVARTRRRHILRLA